MERQFYGSVVHIALKFEDIPNPDETKYTREFGRFGKAPETNVWRDMITCPDGQRLE